MKGHFKAIILLVLGLMLLIPFASTFPDGLETVAENLGVKEHEPIWPSLMSDYNMLLIDNPYISKFFAGMFGIFLVLFAAFLVGKAITRKEKPSTACT